MFYSSTPIINPNTPLKYSRLFKVYMYNYRFIIYYSSCKTSLDNTFLMCFETRRDQTLGSGNINNCDQRLKTR